MNTNERTEGLYQLMDIGDEIETKIGNPVTMSNLDVIEKNYAYALNGKTLKYKIVE